MGLDKRARAEKKALKEQKVREYRRKTKEWVRNLDGDTYQGYEAIWEQSNGAKFQKPFKHQLPKDSDYEV